MHEGHDRRQVVPECSHRLGEVGSGVRAEVARLGVAAHQHRQVNVGHEFQQSRMPLLGEALPRRKVTGGPSTGVVEVHRQQREQVGVAKLLFGDPEPLEELRAAGVVPREVALRAFLPGAWPITTTRARPPAT